MVIKKFLILFLINYWMGRKYDSNIFLRKKILVTPLILVDSEYVCRITDISLVVIGAMQDLLCKVQQSKYFRSPRPLKSVTTTQTCHCSGKATLHSQQHCVRLPAFPHSCQH